jgi:zinc protease
VQRSERLPSGLQLVLEPRTTAPVVAFWLRLGVGALREEPGQAGAAHFLEHMLFKGSRDPSGGAGVAPGEIGPLMDALGADLNAYTTHEETVVHCTLPVEHADKALALMGEMVFHCRLDADQVERERDVVLDELIRSQDDAARQLADGIARRCWGRHPYGRSVLGSAQSVAAVSPAALQDFHRRWYHPENAHLVVVGDIDPDQIRSVASTARFRRGSQEPGWRGDAPLPPLPPAPRAPHFVRIGGAFEEQILELALRVPGHGHPDLPAIDLLCSVLGEGASALLPQRLYVERSVAHGAWAATEIGQQGGTLVCGATPSTDDSAEALEALVEVLHRLRCDGVPVDAFQRAKASILADRAYSDQSSEGRAAVLSFYLGNYGSAEAEGRYRGSIEALRLGEVERAARIHLRLERATLGVVGQGLDLDPGRALRTLHPPAARSARIGPRPSTRPVRKVLPNGVRVLIEPVQDASVTALRVLGLGGGLLETAASAGHGRAWSDLLAEGCGHLEASAFAQAIEGLSGSFGGFSSLSIGGLSGSFPSDRFGVAMHLLLLPLLHPRFDEEAVDRVVAGMQDALRTRADSGAEMAWDAMMALAFPGHPYRLAPGGTERSVARIDPRAMHRYHRRLVRAENLVVAVSGAVDPASILEQLEGFLVQIPRGAPGLPAFPTAARPRRRRRTLLGGWQQAQILMSFQTCPVDHPDRPALDVLGALLGSPGGRLFLQLREEAGLSYDVQAHHLSAVQGGLFSAGMGTMPGRLDEAERALRGSLAQLHREPPSRLELDRAVASLRGGSAMDLQRSSYRALRMAQDERFGLDGRRYRARLDDVRAVGLEDLRRVAKQYLRSDRALEVIAKRG